MRAALYCPDCQGLVYVEYDISNLWCPYCSMKVAKSGGPDSPRSKEPERRYGQAAAPLSVGVDAD